MVPFTEENGFHPPNSAYFDRGGLNAKTHLLPIISNPGNPTGHTRAGAELEELIAMAEQPKNGILLDEAYEFFHPSKGVSGIRYVKDLDNSNVFLAGACTKGLQCPGIRVGWIIASKKNIETLANYSSFGMGGVSHPSQLYAVELLKPERVALAREAVERHYGMQRARYGEAFEKMGLEVRPHRRRRLLPLDAAARRPERRASSTGGCSSAAPPSSRASTATWGGRTPRTPTTYRRTVRGSGSRSGRCCPRRSSPMSRSWARYCRSTARTWRRGAS